MDIEYEATFTKIDRDNVRERLRAAGAQCTRPEFLQRRYVFQLPEGHEISGGWLRVRDEGNRVTMSVKVVDGDHIEDQKEICVGVDHMEHAVELLEAIGCVRKAYQETRREQWILDGVEIDIDEWPWLEPFVEVEGASEEAVRVVSERIGFDWTAAKFCQVATLYAEKYGLAEDTFNSNSPRVIFEGDNPFV
ncbi:MAG: CYTH domain-containing protein [Candidatus Uhrbacteria bacterium]